MSDGAKYEVMTKERQVRARKVAKRLDDEACDLLNMAVTNVQEANARLSSLEKERDELKAKVEIGNRAISKQERELMGNLAKLSASEDRERGLRDVLEVCKTRIEYRLQKEKLAGDLYAMELIAARLSASEAKLDVFKVYLANADKRCDALAVKLDASEAREKGLRVLLLRARDGSGTHAFDCRTLNSISDKCDCNADQNLCDEINAALALPSQENSKEALPLCDECATPTEKVLMLCDDCQDEMLKHSHRPDGVPCPAPSCTWNKRATPEPVKEPDNALGCACSDGKRTEHHPHCPLSRAEPVKEECDHDWRSNVGTELDGKCARCGDDFRLGRFEVTRTACFGSGAFARVHTSVEHYATKTEALKAIGKEQVFTWEQFERAVSTAWLIQKNSLAGLLALTKKALEER